MPGRWGSQRGEITTVALKRLRRDRGFSKRWRSRYCDSKNWTCWKRRRFSDSAIGGNVFTIDDYINPPDPNHLHYYIWRWFSQIAAGTDEVIRHAVAGEVGNDIAVTGVDLREMSDTVFPHIIVQKNLFES